MRHVRIEEVAQIARADAGRIEALHDTDRALHFLDIGVGADGLPKWNAPELLQVDGQPFRIMAGPGGSIQGPCEAKWGYTTLSVADWDGDHLAIQVLFFRAGKMVVVLDDDEAPPDPSELRGFAALPAPDDGDVFVDQQTRAYSGGRRRRFYGDVYPVTQRARETRVTFRIEVMKANTDAVFK